MEKILGSQAFVSLEGKSNIQELLQRETQSNVNKALNEMIENKARPRPRPRPRQRSRMPLRASLVNAVYKAEKDEMKDLRNGKDAWKPRPRRMTGRPRRTRRMLGSTRPRRMK